MTVARHRTQRERSAARAQTLLDRCTICVISSRSSRRTPVRRLRRCRRHFATRTRR